MVIVYKMIRKMLEVPNVIEVERVVEKTIKVPRFIEKVPQITEVPFDHIPEQVVMRKVNEVPHIVERIN